MEFLETLSKNLSDTVWGWPDIFPLMVAILLVTGLVMTVSLRFLQIRQLKHGFDVIRGRYDDPKHDGDLSHFQALTTALSATVGIGNIAGVATAIHYGGPGALFWMWVTAVFGMALKYAECTLAIRHRQILPDGSASGGPMYYIEQGLGQELEAAGRVLRPLRRSLELRFGEQHPVVHRGGSAACGCRRADVDHGARLRDAGGGGHPRWRQAHRRGHEQARALDGGHLRDGRPAGRRDELRQRARRPRRDRAVAFRPAAQIGGFAGGTFIFMLTWGVKRGLFSNESGQGSAPIAHAAAKTDQPVREGVVAMLGPLIDTLVICTITGLVILLTGVWKDKKLATLRVNAQSSITVAVQTASDTQPTVLVNGVVADETKANGTIRVQDGVVLPDESEPQQQRYVFVVNHSTVEDARIYKTDAANLARSDELFSGELTVEDGEIQREEGQVRLWLDGKMAQNGSPLTAWAFQEGLRPFGDWGYLIITLGVVLFGISTAISWSYYGDRAVVYLFGPQYVLPYKIVFCVMNFLGAILALEVVWNFGDTALGLMALPNLIALVLLSRKVKGMTRDYFSQEHKPLR
jgi:AGCS family alanine or glycine:cation symporter